MKTKLQPSSKRICDYARPNVLMFLMLLTLSNLNSQLSTFGQVFTNINAALPGVLSSSAAWGDYDNDGRLDILLTGTTNGSYGGISDIWRNTGSGFTNIHAPLQENVSLGSVAWGDYDNDGRLDVVLSGILPQDNSYVVIAQLLANTGNGFATIPALPREQLSAPVWGDYDNDGRLDILISGPGLLRNTVSSGFIPIYDSGLQGGHAWAVWGDYDNDGRLDLLLTGVPIEVWRNTGRGFTNINAGLSGGGGSGAWGDYDNDGLLDLLLTSADTNGFPITQVWRNTGGGFTNINAGLTGVSGTAAWGDYDNDGRLDILLAGFDTNYSDAISQVWRNTGTGFTNINAGLPGVVGTVAWGDYDNDGRLDILLTGNTNSSGSGGITQVWRNNSAGATNTMPNAPTGLTATLSGSNLVLSWNPATDGQTPAAGLTYNVRVGSTPGTGNVVGPMATSTGYRLLPQMGNAGHGLTAIIPIVPGITNYCSVQAVDSAFAGSPFSAEVSVKVLQWEAPPIIAPLNVNKLPIGDYNGNGVIGENELSNLLTNYFANSPWLLMTNTAGLGGTNVTFALTNSTAGSFSVEVSTNLSSWQFLGPSTPRYLFTDTNAPAVPQRYYRLRWP